MRSLNEGGAVRSCSYSSQCTISKGGRKPRSRSGWFAAANSTIFCWYHHATDSLPSICGRIASTPRQPRCSNSLTQYDRYCSLIWFNLRKARTGRELSALRLVPPPSILAGVPPLRGTRQDRRSDRIGVACLDPEL